MLTFNKSRNDSQTIAHGKAEIDLEHEAYRALSSRRKTPADAEAVRDVFLQEKAPRQSGALLVT
jgi:hypothetical protein